MVQKKVVVKEAPKHKRGLDFSCSKELKIMRGSMTKQQFRIMILNEKSSQAKKDKKPIKDN